MVDGLLILAVSFFFSFLGSIPPGSINLSVLQLSLEGKKSAAYRFALAAALIEFPYTLIALFFESQISDNPWIQNNFSLLTAIVMLSLGIIGLYSQRNPSAKWEKYKHSGFRKGIVISILNPLAIPFWVGVTAWLRSQGLVALSDTSDRIVYAIGVSSGTFALLAVLALIAAPIGDRFANHPAVRKSPAFIFLLLGVYSLLQMIF